MAGEPCSLLDACYKGADDILEKVLVQIPSGGRDNKWCKQHFIFLGCIIGWNYLVSLSLSFLIYHHPIKVPNAVMCVKHSSVFTVWLLSSSPRSLRMLALVEGNSTAVKNEASQVSLPGFKSCHFCCNHTAVRRWHIFLTCSLIFSSPNWLVKWCPHPWVVARV